MSDAASKPRDPPAPRLTLSERLAALEAERVGICSAFEWPAGDLKPGELSERGRFLMRTIHRTADEQLKIRKALERAGYKCDGSWPDGVEIATKKPGADFAPWQESEGVEKLVYRIALLEGAAAASEQRATEQQERAAAACERANAAEARATEATERATEREKQIIECEDLAKRCVAAAQIDDERARAMAGERDAMRDQLRAVQTAQGIAEQAYDALGRACVNLGAPDGSTPVQGIAWLQRERMASQAEATTATEMLDEIAKALDAADVVAMGGTVQRVAAVLGAAGLLEKAHQKLRIEADRRTDVANKEIERANRVAERCQAAEQALEQARSAAEQARSAPSAADREQRRQIAELEQALQSSVDRAKEAEAGCEQLSATIDALQNEDTGALATRVAALEQAIVRLVGRVG